jgi:hypothetical protein
MTTVDRTAKNVCLTNNECILLSALLKVVRTEGFNLNKQQDQALQRISQELDDAVEHKETQFV